MTLEPKYALNLQALPQKKGNDFGIQIGGLCGHSAYAVKNIEVEKDGQVLTILVWLTPAKQGLTGSFSEWVPVSDEIMSVVFGKAKKVIWSRKS